jgi:ABC-type uncharacterized transport system substrate-binding protein
VVILDKTEVSVFPDLLMCGAHPMVFIWMKTQITVEKYSCQLEED